MMGRAFEYMLLMVMVGCFLLLGSAMLQTTAQSLKSSANMISQATGTQ